MALGRQSSIVATFSPLQAPAGDTSSPLPPWTELSPPPPPGHRPPPCSALPPPRPSGTRRRRGEPRASAAAREQPLPSAAGPGPGRCRQGASGTPPGDWGRVQVPEAHDWSRRLADVGPCKSWTAESDLARGALPPTASRGGGAPAHAPATARQGTFLDRRQDAPPRRQRRTSLDSAALPALPFGMLRSGTWQGDNEPPLGQPLWGPLRLCSLALVCRPGQGGKAGEPAGAAGCTGHQRSSGEGWRELYPELTQAASWRATRGYPASERPLL